MKKYSKFNLLIASFGLICLFSLGYLQFSENNNENNFLSSRMTSSQKNKKIKNPDKNTILPSPRFIIGDAINQGQKLTDEPSVLFNDPAIKQAWGLKKSDAARAWSISKGSKKVIVAVIDTGIDISHEDLKNNLWKNPGETGLDKNGKDKATNGIDDDSNGFIDDVYGWNFVSNNNSLTDNHGHGTHIAGIIGAEAGNKKGISGVSPEVSLMVLKYYDPKVPNTDNLKNTINSINYAVKMGAHIINYSGGGTEFSQDEHDSILAAERKGILFVAAAGNEKSNSDEFHYYPADYKLKNIISVTAIDPTTEVLNSSNYGTETVDIAAPGQGIISCLPNNTYGLMTGTSQATAFVTGAAVLVAAHKEIYKKPEDFYNETKKFILATGDTNESLIAKTKTSRQLNLFKALTLLEKSTSISGIKTQINDRRLFSTQTVDNNDPNDTKQGVQEITTFGQDLAKVINATKGQLTDKKQNNLKNQKDRLGEKNTVPENNDPN